MESTKQGAVENIGNLLALLCISFTVQGKDLMTRSKLNNDEKDIATPLIALLAYIGWLHSTNPKVEVENAMPAVYDLIRDMKAFFDRNDGNGWDLPKIHGMIQMLECIVYFGSAKNQYGGPGEQSHKKYLKDPSNRSRRQPASFLTEVATRIEENVVIEASME
eukprot:scaffold376871_cov387-Cyclotella_meneghiniana.AAC.1